MSDGHDTNAAEMKKGAAGNTPDRLLSVDALRGFDMFWIIGGSTLIHDCAKLRDTPVMRVLDQQFEHVKWEGFHCYDLIFPLFMLLMGVVLPYTIARRKQRGETRGPIAIHFFKRTAALIALGLIYEGILRFQWDQMRWSAVLTLIGGSYFIAALIALFFSIRSQVIWTAAILLGYWAALACIGAEMNPNGQAIPFGKGDYSVEHSLISYLDQRFLPGLHPYGGATNGVGLFFIVHRRRQRFAGRFSRSV